MIRDNETDNFVKKAIVNFIAKKNININSVCIKCLFIKIFLQFISISHNNVYVIANGKGKRVCSCPKKRLKWQLSDTYQDTCQKRLEFE